MTVRMQNSEDHQHIEVFYRDTHIFNLVDPLQAADLVTVLQRADDLGLALSDLAEWLEDYGYVIYSMA